MKRWKNPIHENLHLIYDVIFLLINKTQNL